MSSMETRLISITPAHYPPEFRVLIDVPANRDPVEYIEAFLDWIIDTDIRPTISWSFVDGIS